MKYKRPQKHNRGIEIAKQLFPGLIVEPPGTWWDRAGIDGYLGDKEVQVKFDGRIALSNNIYHEIYEKPANHPEQPWHVAIGKVKYYIFTTEDAIEIKAIKLPVDKLAELEKNKSLTCLSPNLGAPTSLGYLISLNEVIEYADIRSQIKKRNSGHYG